MSSRTRLQPVRDPASAAITGAVDRTTQNDLPHPLPKDGKNKPRLPHPSRFSKGKKSRLYNLSSRASAFCEARDLGEPRDGDRALSTRSPRNRASGSHPYSSKRRKKSPHPRELTTKRRGELAELAFTYKAATMGFGVAKPYGDSERYDFVLDSAGRFVRVQVKSSTTLLNGLYHINCHRRTGGRAVPYSPSEIDFLVAYIIPEDAWFILPITVVAHRTSLLFNPKGYPRGDGLFGAYREAWHLLRQFPLPT
jgi:PD-(D/E)XK endonuclease